MISFQKIIKACNLIMKNRPKSDQCSDHQQFQQTFQSFVNLFLRYLINSIHKRSHMNSDKMIDLCDTL